MDMIRLDVENVVYYQYSSEQLVFQDPFFTISKSSDLPNYLQSALIDTIIEDENIEKIRDSSKSEGIFHDRKSEDQNKNLVLEEQKKPLREATYDIYKLLLIGFLYCEYQSEDKHMEDLWNILNP